MEIKTIEWKNNKIRLIDQTLLPNKLKYLDIDNLKDLWRAIKTLQVRGAPAIGAAAALGVYLGVKDSRVKNFTEFTRELEKVIAYIASSRPTARNLFWALERMRKCVEVNKTKSTLLLKQALLSEAKQVIEEDRVICRNIGKHGAALINSQDTILTVCNAGSLATIDYGTALGVIYSAQAQEKNIKVFACETRPILQGARLTTWELEQRGVDVTLICDNMAATLMQQGKIDKVIAGADRIAANADTANKIGTYSLAVLAKYHKIPFYIAAPSSTFDLSIKTGQGIPIEERDPKEITELFFKTPMAPAGVKVFNPAFDVTPHRLISAIITENGVIRPPYGVNIKNVFARSK